MNHMILHVPAVDEAGPHVNRDWHVAGAVLFSVGDKRAASCPHHRLQGHMDRAEVPAEHPGDTALASCRWANQYNTRNCKITSTAFSLIVTVIVLLINSSYFVYCLQCFDRTSFWSVKIE